MTLMSILVNAITKEIPQRSQPALSKDKIKKLKNQLDRFKVELIKHPSAKITTQSIEHLTYAVLREKRVSDIDQGLKELQQYIQTPAFQDKKYRSMISKIVHAIQKEMRVLNENPYDEDKVHKLFVQIRTLEHWLQQKPVSNDGVAENNLMNKPLKIIEHLLDSLRQKGIQSIDKEIQDITRGWYQIQINTLSYRWQNRSEKFGVKSDVKKLDKDETFLVYSIIEEAGLSCSVALPSEPVYHQPEIFITFAGTHDFASTAADMDKGGPGQALLKKYEAKLIEQVNSVIAQMSLIYPNQTFRIRLQGHSLGGALAKGFAHTLQRACAVQENSTDGIIERINTNIGFQRSSNTSQQNLLSLGEKLNADRDKFKNLKALKNIEGITVYALGAPGVSNETDRHGTLLTYYHHPDFLRVFNHYHKEDIICKFGESEFLSGKNGVPRILANKAIQFETEVSEMSTDALPFQELPAV